MSQSSNVQRQKLILGIRTDRPEASVILAELSLRGSDSDRGNLNIIDQTDWTAGRQLSNTLLKTIEDLIKKHNKTWGDIAGVVVFQGPGSFTGLRIGLTVGNTLAFEQNIPIAGSTGDNWFADGVKKLPSKFTAIVMPEYGGEANITQPKK